MNRTVEISFERDMSNGSFTFGDQEQIVEERRFVPVSQAKGVTKMEINIWKGLPL